MKLIVGLGNPGRKYEGTRHNVGFVVIEKLLAKFATDRPKENFQGEVCEADLKGERALCLKPFTFMNCSGGSVLAARDFYKLPLTDLLIVCDDINLPLGKLRFRPRGAAGGQKGLSDILQRLGTEEIPRLRIGVGQAPAGWDAADFVLARFLKEEQTEIEIAVATAVEAIPAWAAQGIDICMNQYN